MTSIKDVAKAAGVSVMTASRVMNHNGSVSQGAKQRVLEAAKSLGYRPNLTARSLRVQRSQLIGLLLPDIENPIFASLAKHVEEAANRLGYNVMLSNTWEDREREAHYIELMESRQMEGLIISPVAIENEELIANCLIPTVVLDRSFNHKSPPPNITVDNYEVGRLAAEHLCSLGHRNFACIPGPLHIAVFAERLQGFREELARQNRRLEAVISAGNISRLDYGSQFFTEIIRLCPERPLALFCANDITALGAVQAAQRMGLRVPDDVSIIGVDDIMAGKLSMPALTTIHQPFAEIAEAGVKVLVNMLRDPTFKPENVILQPDLIVRESTGTYAGSGKMDARQDTA